MIYPISELAKNKCFNKFNENLDFGVSFVDDNMNIYGFFGYCIRNYRENYNDYFFDCDFLSREIVEYINNQTININPKSSFFLKNKYLHMLLGEYRVTTILFSDEDTEGTNEETITGINFTN